MAWLMLAISIVLQVAGTVFLKVSDGMVRLWPAAGVVVCYTISFWLFALAIRRIDLAVGYAIWSSIGTATIALIVTGVVGLNVR